MADTDTPGSPEAPEPDSDQLPLEDTLVPRGVGDLLDEGYSPPDRPRTNHWGETPLEEVLGEPLDARLAEEEPEVWDPGYHIDPGTEPDRAGRLTVDDDAGLADPTGAGSQDLWVDDVGIAGGAASAEEAAMHVIPEDDDADSLYPDNSGS